MLIHDIAAFRPSKNDWIFAFKTLLSAFLALYISFSLDFLKPVLSMGSVFLVSLPLSGMVISKSIGRLLGTLLGATMAVLTMPHLINYPVLYAVFLACWVGVCIYVCMIDASPIGNIALFAAYMGVIATVEIIFNIDKHISIYDIVFNRVMENAIAVIITAVVSVSIFPQHIGDSIKPRINRALEQTLDVLRKQFQTEHPEQTLQDVTALNSTVYNIQLSVDHLLYEKSKYIGMYQSLRELLRQFSLVFLNLASLAQRLAQLDRLQPKFRSQMQPLIEEVISFLKRPGKDIRHPEELPAQYNAFFEDPRLRFFDQTTQTTIEAVRMDLRHFIQSMNAIHLIWYNIGMGRRRLPKQIEQVRHAARPHRDHGMALRGAFASFLAVTISMLLWIYSGWLDGYMMAQFTAISACILTRFDDPVPGLKQFTLGSTCGLVLLYLYLFYIFPSVTSFVQLMIVFTPVIIACTLVFSNPKLYGFGLASCVGFIMSTNLHNTYVINPQMSIESAIGTVLGPMISLTCMYYIRAVSPDTSAKRILSAHYQSLAKAVQLNFGARLRLQLREIVDRIALLNTKVVSDQDLHRALNESLLESTNILDLNRLHEIEQLDNTPSTVKSAIRRVRQLYTKEYRSQARQFQGQPYYYEAILKSLQQLQRQAFQMDDDNYRERVIMACNNLYYDFLFLNRNTQEVT